MSITKPTNVTPEPHGWLYGNSFWEATNRRITDHIKQFGQPMYSGAALASVQAQPFTDEQKEWALIAAGRIANARSIKTTDAYAIVAAYATALSIQAQPNQRVCKGKNCTAINGIGHSRECEAEHDKTVIAGLMDTPGNRHPHHRYAGYRCQALPAGSSDDQRKAWEEGCKATRPQAQELPTKEEIERLAHACRQFDTELMDEVAAMLRKLSGVLHAPNLVTPLTYEDVKSALRQIYKDEVGEGETDDDLDDATEDERIEIMKFCAAVELAIAAKRL